MLNPEGEDDIFPRYVGVKICANLRDFQAQMIPTRIAAICLNSVHILQLIVQINK
jgi:hypothetical protein